MSLTDPIADMLTVIRNANMLLKETAEVPASNLKEEILRVLKEKGYIQNYKTIDQKTRKLFRVYLRQEGSKKSSITGLRRISKPGLRVYAPKNRIPKVLGGIGMAILSTSKGVLTDKEARQQQIGGEVLCYVW
ncbi:MAG: 30S ribosomal protein S8 [Candidatus Omnitrophota bacterium]